MNYCDGLTNVLLGLGTTADRQATTTYSPQSSSTQAAAQAWTAVYDSASVGQKVVDIPALDATREWRSWQLPAPAQARMRALEARLGYQAKVLEALRSARLYGGAALYAADGLEPNEPLRGPIQGLRVLSRALLKCAPTRVSDLARPDYGQPDWFQLRDQSGSEAITLHPTRLALFFGIRRPLGELRGLDSFWGQSALTPVLGPLKALDAALHNAAALFHKAVVDTVRIPGLSRELRRAEGEAAVRQRLEALKLGMSVHNLAALDGEEILERPAITFAGQDKLMREFAQMVSAASDIPVTRLFGRSPAGLSATGESDMRNYYDRIREIQAADIGPALHGFDRFLLAQIGISGAQQETLPYTWTPLWQERLDTKAQIALTFAQAMKTAVEVDILPKETAQESLQIALKQLGLVVQEGAV